MFRLRGQSWLLTQPRKFLRMFFWSVTVWLSFEAFNLVLKNWGYVAMEPVGWVRWGGYALAFATVLPGVLLTAQVLDALGAWKNLKARPFNPGAWQPVSLLVGVALLILPLTFPRYAFPLIWGAVFLPAGPLLRAFGRALPHRPLHPGRTPGAPLSVGRGPDLRPLVGSLELLRHQPSGSTPCRCSTSGRSSRCRSWGSWGFPPFALECAVMYNFLTALDDRVLTTPTRRRYSYVVQLAFWIIMFAAMDAWTVISYQ